MQRKSKLFVLFIFSLLSPWVLMALNDLGEDQQKEVSQLLKQLFKATEKNDVFTMQKILRSHMPEGYRPILFETPHPKTKKTLLQAAFPKYTDPFCSLLCSPIYKEKCTIHPKNTARCGERFMLLLREGAPISQMTSQELIPSTNVFIKNFPFDNFSFAKMLFSHSPEFTQAILQGTNCGLNLAIDASKKNNIEIFNLILEQPGANLAPYRRYIQGKNDNFKRAFDRWVKKNKVDIHAEILKESISEGNLDGLRKDLTLIDDGKNLIRAADAGLLHAYSLWLKITSSGADLAHVKILATLLKAGGSFKSFSREQLLARNRYLGYTLLHSAAHLGGNDGEILARATLAHSPEVAQRLIKLQSENRKTPLALAKDYNAANVTKVILETMPKRDREDNSITIQSLDD